MEPTQADRLAEQNRTVQELYESGARASALRLARQAVDEGERTLGSTHPLAVQAANNLAGILDAFGDFAEARTMYERVIASLRAAGDPTFLAIVLTNLAVGYASVCDYAAGVPLVEEALELRRRALGPDHPLTMRSRQTLAGLYGAMGEFEHAAEYFPEPTERPADGQVPPSLAGVLWNEARRFESEGKYRAARPLYARAVEAARRTFGQRYPLVAAMLNNLGLVDQALGDLGAAEASFRAALNHLEGRAEDAVTAQAFHNLGWLLTLKGEYREAEPLLRKALSLRQDALGTETELIADTLNNLGLLRFATGSLDSAVDLLEQAAALRDTAATNWKRLADTDNNLGLVYRAVGRDSDAAQHYQQALERRREALGPWHPDVAQSLNNLAVLRLSAGRHGEAAEAAEAALQIRAKALGERHPDYAQSLNNLAVIEQTGGNYDRALQLAEQSAAVFNESLGPRHPNLVPPLQNAAVSLISLGRHQDALSAVLRVARVENEVIASVFPVAVEEQRRMIVNRARATMEVALHLLAGGTDLGPKAVNDVLNVVIARKGLVAAVAATQREAILAGRYPQLAGALRKLTDLRQRIAAATLAGHALDASSEPPVAEWQSRYEQVERELASEMPEIELSRRLQSATVETIAAAVPAGAVLVELLRTDPGRLLGLGRTQGEPGRYVAFVIFPGEPGRTEFVELGDADRIDALVAAYRVALTGRTDERRLITTVPRSTAPDPHIAGPALRTALVEPLFARLDATKLYIAPDGGLTRLPFAALPTRDGYLIDQLEIGYLDAGRDILRLGSRDDGLTAPALVVADPDFDHHGPASGGPVPGLNHSPRGLREYTARFQPLPATREEGTYVARLLGVTPLLGDQARDPVVKAARSPQVLHLATHGFFIADAPPLGDTRLMDAPTQTPFTLLRCAENPLLRSGLALVGANAWLTGQPLDPLAEDGLLTAEDVCSMDLLGTRLVVLSACDTGLGEIRNGEGVQGLRRAFVEAGARTVVMSLWKVPDRETMQLMIHFHEQLQAGERCATALRAAQQTIREQHSHPEFWGAFICLGDPGPLSHNAT